jgi:hypothetical protein
MHVIDTFMHTFMIVCQVMKRKKRNRWFKEEHHNEC